MALQELSVKYCLSEKSIEAIALNTII
jgi:hypothetical protein